MLAPLRLTGVNQSSYIGTIVALSGWVLYFTFVHTHLYNQLCSLDDSFPFPLPQIARGSYWGGVVFSITMSFRQLPKPGLRTSLVIAIFACIVVLAQDVGIHGLTEARNWMTGNIQPGTAAFWWMVGCYALILAIPFMPGIELGLLLMLMYGIEGIVAVYGATILGLLLPYLIGRTLPEYALQGLLKNNIGNQFKLPRWYNAPSTVIRIANSRLINNLLRCRPLVLAAAFNLPCNSLIGGGGSIALVAGAQRFVSFVPYLLVITLATLPVPLLAFAGVIQIDALLEGQELTQNAHFCIK